MKYYASWIRLKDIYYPKYSGKIVTAVGLVLSALIMVNKLGKQAHWCMHFGRWIWTYGNNDIYVFTGKMPNSEARKRYVHRLAISLKLNVKQTH